MSDPLDRLTYLIQEHTGCWPIGEAVLYCERHGGHWPCETLADLTAAVQAWAEDTYLPKPETVTWYLATCKACDITQPFTDQRERNTWAHTHGNTHHHITLAVFPEHLDQDGIPLMELRTETRPA